VPVSISPILDRYHIHTDDAGLTHFTALEGFDFHHTPAGSDVHALFDRCITVTPMHFDPTHHGELAAWSQRMDAVAH
jgi:broad specificity polyphosphatase/5'/3'-nucleotidase SurE